MSDVTDKDNDKKQAVDSGGNTAKVVALMILIVICFSYTAYAVFFKDKRTDEELNYDKMSESELAEKWLYTVSSEIKANSVDDSVNSARFLVKDSNQIIDQSYFHFLKANKLVEYEPEFLSRQFNAWDENYWRSAYFFKKKAAEICAGNPEDEVEALFNAVVKQIKPEKKTKTIGSFPVDIWKRGWGLCDRSSWVLSELAYQQGYETSLVILYNTKDRKESPHTICEIRKGKDVWICDTTNNKIKKGFGYYKLFHDKAALNDFWPEDKELQTALEFSILHIPSFAEDYSHRNKVLNQKLKKQLGDKCPRFGEDYLVRARRFEGLILIEGDVDYKYSLRPWHYPIVISYTNRVVLSQQ